MITALALVLPTGAFADWREDIGRFRIGIVSQKSGTAAISDVEPFRLGVEEKLGVPVEIIPMTDLRRLASAHAEGRVEYAVYPATTFAAVQANCECVEPLVVAMADDKTVASYSVLIGRTNSQGAGTGDLAGKKLWLLTRENAIGQQYAVSGMKSAGLTISDGTTGFLSADNPRAALERFSRGEGDALIGWSSMQGDLTAGYSRGTLRQLAELNGGSASDFRILWKSAPLAHRTHAIRKNLDGEAKRLLREMLTSMYEKDPVAYDAIEPVYGGGFQIAPQSLYTGAVEFINSLIPEQSGQGINDGEQSENGTGNGDTDDRKTDNENTSN